MTISARITELFDNDCYTLAHDIYAGHVSFSLFADRELGLVYVPTPYALEKNPAYPSRAHHKAATFLFLAKVTAHVDLVGEQKPEPESEDEIAQWVKTVNDKARYLDEIVTRNSHIPNERLHEIIRRGIDEYIEIAKLGPSKQKAKPEPFTPLADIPLLPAPPAFPLLPARAPERKPAITWIPVPAMQDELPMPVGAEPKRIGACSVCDRMSYSLEMRYVGKHREEVAVCGPCGEQYERGTAQYTAAKLSQWNGKVKA